MKAKEMRSKKGEYHKNIENYISNKYSNTLPVP